jgi:2-oxo-3-hexenedioate decarboxylase
LAEPQIEPEIVFGLRAAPSETSDPSLLLQSIEWIAHGFEIVQSHFPGWKFRAADTVADNGLHGMLLIGPPQPLAALGEKAAASLQSFSVELSRNGAVVEVGKGANVLGSPLAALAHLVSVLAGSPGSEKLKAGDIVTTGTLTAAYRVASGELWRTELRGIPLPGLALGSRARPSARPIRGMESTETYQAERAVAVALGLFLPPRGCWMSAAR